MTHVPPPPVQVWQAPQDALPQQCPSTHAPLAHSVALAHVWPFAFLHAPLESQVIDPLQVSSVVDFLGLHVPWVPVRLHAVHAPVQAVLQQVLSTQFPPVHSGAVMQV